MSVAPAPPFSVRATAAAVEAELGPEAFRAETEAGALLDVDAAAGEALACLDGAWAAGASPAERAC